MSQLAWMLFYLGIGVTVVTCAAGLLLSIITASSDDVKRTLQERIRDFSELLDTANEDLLRLQEAAPVNCGSQLAQIHARSVKAAKDLAVMSEKQILSHSQKLQGIENLERYKLLLKDMPMVNRILGYLNPRKDVRKEEELVRELDEHWEAINELNDVWKDASELGEWNEDEEGNSETTDVGGNASSGHQVVIQRVVNNY